VTIGAVIAAAHSEDNPEVLPTDPLQRAIRLQELHPMMDSHNDLPWAYRLANTRLITDITFRRLVNNVITLVNLEAEKVNYTKDLHTDIPRLKQGVVGGQFWSVYVPCQMEYKVR
jgi:membrane dipeptidase